MSYVGRIQRIRRVEHGMGITSMIKCAFRSTKVLGMGNIIAILVKG